MPRSNQSNNPVNGMGTKANGETAGNPLVQFRLDAKLHAALEKIAKAYKTTPSLLVKRWAIERLPRD